MAAVEAAAGPEDLAPPQLRSPAPQPLLTRARPSSCCAALLRQRAAGAPPPPPWSSRPEAGAAPLPSGKGASGRAPPPSRRAALLRREARGRERVEGQAAAHPSHWLLSSLPGSPCLFLFAGTRGRRLSPLGGRAGSGGTSRAWQGSLWRRGALMYSRRDGGPVTASMTASPLESQSRAERLGSPLISPQSAAPNPFGPSRLHHPCV